MTIGKKSIFFLIVLFVFSVVAQEAPESELAVIIAPAHLLEKTYNPHFLYFRYFLEEKMQLLLIGKKEEYSQKDSVQFIRKLLQKGRPDLHREFQESARNGEWAKQLQCPYCSQNAQKFPYLWYHFVSKHAEYINEAIFDRLLHDKQRG